MSNVNGFMKEKRRAGGLVGTYNRDRKSINIQHFILSYNICIQHVVCRFTVNFFFFKYTYIYLKSKSQRYSQYIKSII